MTINLQPLNIKRIIVHEVSGHVPHQEKALPVRGTELEILEEEEKQQFEDRIIQVLGRESKSIEVAVEEDGDDSTFQLCAQLLDKGDDNFAALSYTLAEKLAVAQATKSVPGGLVVVFDGEVGQPAKRFIAVLKAEKQGGFVRRERTAGRSWQFLRDIFLTKNDKLYKIAFLQELESVADSGFRDKSHFSVMVYDHLLTRGNREKAAQYFYKAFLQCVFLTTSKNQTRKFFIETQSIINKAKLSQEEKLELHQALHVYVEVNNEPIIDPVHFADAYMPAAMRDEYRNQLIEAGLPAHAITKDVSALQSELKKRSIIWEDKIRLTAPPNIFDDKIEIWIPDDAPDTTMIRVRARIKEQK